MYWATTAVTVIPGVSSADCHCGIGSWGGRRPSLGGYVTGTGATDGVTATGGR
jgi:hypothetical protein